MSVLSEHAIQPSKKKLFQAFRIGRLEILKWGTASSDAFAFGETVLDKLKNKTNLVLVSGGYKIRAQSAVHFLTITVVEWVDVFTRQAYADIIIESLEYCKQNKGLNLYAYVIMSNHVHLIVSASSGNLSDIVRDFKKFTSQSILKEIEQNTKESRRNWMLWLFESAGERKSNIVKYQFWQRDNRPKELTTAAMTRQKLEYIHNNPVKAGIVQEPHEYLYSSAKNYAGMDGLIKVDFLF